MELRDIVVTPFFIVLIYVLAYIFRPYVTDVINRRYYFKALTVKIVGALALGLLYQFYYNGGDTYNFHTHGSRHIWEAFVDDPKAGFKLLSADGTDESGIYKYSSRIPFFRDKSSYAVIKISGFFDLFTFSSYCSTAICFAFLSFIGSWLFFKTFYDEYPHLHFQIAVAVLFIPSVIFWGSGLLKDTITLAALGMSTYCLKKLFIKKEFSILRFLFLALSLYVIFAVKKYILLCYLPAVLFWLYATHLNAIRSKLLQVLLLPFVIILVAVTGYWVAAQVAKDDVRYDLSKLGETAKVTAYDIAYITGRDAGSTYSLGELDGTNSGLIKLAPQAINVALFRPYLWEVRNPLMLMSALESFTLFMLTIYVIGKRFKSFFKIISSPDILFCLIFSLTFAFAVGVSSFNFGTLSRYKIPVMPFYMLFLLLFHFHENKERKFALFDRTE